MYPTRDHRADLVGELVGKVAEAQAGVTQVAAVIDQILAQPGCVGIHFAYGLNEAGQKTLVYVGIDAQGNDLVKRTVVMSSGDLAVADGIMADRIKWTSSAK